MGESTYISIILLLLSVIGYFVVRYFNISDMDKKEFAKSIKQFSDSVSELREWVTELKVVESERKIACDLKHLSIAKDQQETAIKIDKMDKKIVSHTFKIENLEKDVEKLSSRK